MNFNFYNKLHLSYKDKPSAISKFLSKSYGYYLSGDIGGVSFESAVSVNAVDKIEKAGLYFLKNEAAFDSEDFYIIDKNGYKMGLNFNELFCETRLMVENSFDLSLFEEIVTSLISIKLALLRLIPVHASSVKYNDNGIILAGWGGVGKTRFLLKLMESGAEFISDEWTILDGGKARAYFTNINLLSYDILAFPGLVKLGFTDRLRLKFNPCFKIYGLRKILHYGGIRPLGHKSYDSHELFSKTVYDSEFNKLFFLLRYAGDTVKKYTANKEELVSRMYSSFIREHRVFFYYYNLHGFAGITKNKELENAIREIYCPELRDRIKDKECFLLGIPLELDFDQVNIADLF